MRTHCIPLAMTKFAVWAVTAALALGIALGA